MKDGEMEPLATLGGAPRLDDGGPAFPRLDSMEQGDHGRFLAQVSGGMTLRDYFAAKALSTMEIKTDGEYSQDDRRRGYPEMECKWAAIGAYRMADAMLAARKAGA